MTGLFWITVGLSAAAAVGMPVAARVERGRWMPSDFGFAAGIALAMGTVVWVGRTRGRLAGAWALAAAWALVLAAVNGWWWPTVEPNNPRAVAAEFRRRAGDGPYCSFGDVAYLPLCFALRSEVPAAATEADLRAQLAADPRTHVIIRRKRRAAATPPPGLVLETEATSGDDVYELYRPASQAPPASPPQN